MPAVIELREPLIGLPLALHSQVPAGDEDGEERGSTECDHTMKRVQERKLNCRPVGC